VGTTRAGLIRGPQLPQVWSGLLHVLFSSAAYSRFQHAALSVAYGLAIVPLLFSILFVWAFNRRPAARRLY
jgi:hypothetical protein